MKVTAPADTATPLEDAELGNITGILVTGGRTDSAGAADALDSAEIYGSRAHRGDVTAEPTRASLRAGLSRHCNRGMARIHCGATRNGALVHQNLTLQLRAARPPRDELTAGENGCRLGALQAVTDFTMCVARSMGLGANPLQSAGEVPCFDWLTRAIRTPFERRGAGDPRGRCSPTASARSCRAAFGWAARVLRAARHPDYLPIDARYHDLEHTMQGALCLARLLQGRHARRPSPALTVAGVRARRAGDPVPRHRVPEATRRPRGHRREVHGDPRRPQRGLRQANSLPPRAIPTRERSRSRT